MSRQARRKTRRPTPPGTPTPAEPVASSPARASFGWVALTIFTVALLIRALHLWQIRRAPFFPLVVGDGASYDMWARAIAAGDWSNRDVFYQAPLYPYFLGAIYAIVGHDLMVVRVCQSIIGSVSCVLLGAAGWRLFSRRVGLVAGLMLAGSAPAIFSDAVLQKSVLDFFFVCLLLWFASGLVHEPRSRRLWLQAGFALGCLSLTRENALVFLVPLLAWLVLRPRAPATQRLALAAMLCVGLAGALLPVAMRNQVVGGEFHLTTSQFGPNFYIGNNAGATGGYQPLRYGQGAAEFERDDATELAERALGRSLTPGEVSRYWTRLAFDDIVSQPGDWLRLMAWKFALLWNATESADTESQYAHAEWSVPLRLTGHVTHFGVIAPLALFGVWATWARRDQLWLLYAMCATYAASVMMFFVFTRYRYPLVPFLILFASAGLVDARRILRDTRTARLVPCVVAMLALAAFSNWPLVSREAMRATTEDAWGSAFAARGQLDAGARHYRRALELNPDFAGAHSNLAVALRAQGRLDDAIAQYHAALAIDPEIAMTHYNLANVLAEQGHVDESVTQYRRALELAPGSVDAHTNLGILLYSRGRFDQAGEHFQAAIRLDPDDGRAYNNLGKVFEARGDAAGAISYYRLAVQLAPDDGAARGDLGMALLSQDDVEEAIGHLRRALQLDPDAFAIHNDLGVALGTRGRLDEAIGHFRRAIAINPGFAEAHNNLSTTLAAQGKLEEAFDDVPSQPRDR